MPDITLGRVCQLEIAEMKLHARTFMMEILFDSYHSIVYYTAVYRILYSTAIMICKYIHRSTAIF